MALIVGLFGHLAQFFMCAGELLSTGGGPGAFFGVLADLVSFTGCSGLPAFMSLVFFFIFSAPLIAVVASFVFSMFGSEIGAAVAILLGVVTAAVGFFS